MGESQQGKCWPKDHGFFATWAPSSIWTFVQSAVLQAAKEGLRENFLPLNKHSNHSRLVSKTSRASQVIARHHDLAGGKPAWYLPSKQPLSLDLMRPMAPAKDKPRHLTEDQEFLEGLLGREIEDGSAGAPDSLTGATPQQGEVLWAKKAEGFGGRVAGTRNGSSRPPSGYP